MKYKIISAVGGEFIKDKLLENEYEMIGDFNNQEDLFKVLKKPFYNVLILSDTLSGFYSKYAVIKKIKNINKKIKIIMILEESDKKFEEYLEENDIKDFFRNGDFYLEDVMAVIDEYERPSVKTTQKIIQDNDINKDKFAEEPKSLLSLNSQNIFAISGNTGAGKSMFNYIFSTYLSQNSNLKILVIDLDTEKGDINLFFNLKATPEDMDYELPSDKSSGINYIVDMIDKGSFTEYNFQRCLLNKKGLNSVNIITGNTSLNVCLNTLVPIYYEKLLEIAKIKFDVIFLDTSASLFLDSTQFSICNSTNIFFVIEPNILSIERAKRTLKDICENWNINKEKIKIIVNKYQKTSLEKELIKHLLKEYDVVAFIPFSDEIERIFTGDLQGLPKNISDELQYLTEKFGFSRKTKFIDKLFIK